MNEMWASEVERRLRLISDRIAGLNQNALRTEGQAGFGFPVQEQAQSDEEVYWIRLTGKSVVDGVNLYSWRRQVQAVTAGGLVWMDSGDFGTLAMNPAVGLNNEDRSVVDGKRYPAKYNPDTGQWIFFLSEGTGGGSGLHRFPTRYKVWVEWDTVPTLKTGASANVPADGPALAEAVSKMATGYICTATWVLGYRPHFFYDPVVETSYQGAWTEYTYGTFPSSSSQNWYVSLVLHKRDGGDYLIDHWPELLPGPPAVDSFQPPPGPLGDRTLLESDPFKPMNFCLLHRWIRRTALGAFSSYQVLSATRDGGTLVRTSGPKYGESGFWSFPMHCDETDYSNEGDGTIYLGWGDYATTTIVGGGSPGALPPNIISGGTPGSLPSNIISGGVI